MMNIYVVYCDYFSCVLHWLSFLAFYTVISLGMVCSLYVVMSINIILSDNLHQNFTQKFSCDSR